MIGGITQPCSDYTDDQRNDIRLPAWATVVVFSVASRPPLRVTQPVSRQEELLRSLVSPVQWNAGFCVEVIKCRTHHATVTVVTFLTYVTTRLRVEFLSQEGKLQCSEHMLMCEKARSALKNHFYEQARSQKELSVKWLVFLLEQTDCSWLGHMLSASSYMQEWHTADCFETKHSNFYRY